MKFVANSLNLKGRVAIVTGGSRGIGRAAVDCFAKLGANIVVNYVNDEQAAAAAIAFVQEQGAEALAVRADVSRSDEAQRLIDETIKRFGRIDFLVCNAGIWEGGP